MVFLRQLPVVSGMKFSDTWEKNYELPRMGADLWDCELRIWKRPKVDPAAHVRPWRKTKNDVIEILSNRKRKTTWGRHACQTGFSSSECVDDLHLGILTPRYDVALFKSVSLDSQPRMNFASTCFVVRFETYETLYCTESFPNPGCCGKMTCTAL